MADPKHDYRGYKHIDETEGTRGNEKHKKKFSK